MAERVQKIMAHAGVGSRRYCEGLIAEGRVTVNGRRITLGDKADPTTDEIRLDGEKLKPQAAGFIYVILNKPKGVISSLQDELEEGRATVRDLIDLPGHLYPVGRLDKESEGLMLMTNDGDLAHKLTHPRYGHKKTYDVIVEGAMPNTVIARWRHGVLLDGRRTIRAKIELIHRDKTATRLHVTLREGKKRQIRRIAADLGHPVLQLVRTQIGPLRLGSLKPGRWRHLRPEEVQMLRESIK